MRVPDPREYDTPDDYNEAVLVYKLEKVVKRFDDILGGE